MATLLTLPRELHVEIFDYLSHFDHIRLSQTCQQLENILLHNNVLRAARYHSREGDEHQYHKLLNWFNHPDDEGFGGFFCTARGGVVQRYMLIQGYQGGSVRDACEEGCYERSYNEKDDKSAAGAGWDDELGEEAEENIIIMRDGLDFLRFHTMDISNHKFLDEPFSIPKSQTPASTTKTINVKCTRYLENIEPGDWEYEAQAEEAVLFDHIDPELDQIEWDDEVQIGENSTVRGLIEYFIKQSQLKTELSCLKARSQQTRTWRRKVKGVRKNSRNENFVVLAQGKENWQMAIWQNLVQDDIRRYIWCPRSNSKYSFTIWKSEKAKQRYENRVKLDKKDGY
ncbi:hypothetical protein AA313_de0207512 [Arthrobotrys entomopaga]|nr:hypothetical protein AA313_de0207512 [Arthrobotrys entomopaga]